MKMLEIHFTCVALVLTFDGKYIHVTTHQVHFFQVTFWQPAVVKKLSMLN